MSNGQWRTAWRASVAVCVVGVMLSGCADERRLGPDIDATDADLVANAATAPAFDLISAGGGHTCAIATDDRAYCWGFNNFGQVGDGTKETRTRPVLVKGGLLFNQLRASEYRTCGVSLASKIWCWAGTPARFDGGRSYRQVSVGPEHSCAVTTDSRVYCWGRNVFGELGNGTWKPDGQEPLSPVAVVGDHRFLEVSVGAYHSCGIATDHRAYCWGGDQWGQIGDGSGSGTCGFSQPCRKAPTLVAGGYRFLHISAGGGLGPGEDGVGGTPGGRTCGVTTDNRALCWGWGKEGQNGEGTSLNRKAPVLVAGGHAFKSAETGVWHSCGVTTDDVAYCWGSNWGGQLGDGTTTDRSRPTPVSGGRLFSRISPGHAHTCALTRFNVAFCWGVNGGALGDGTLTERHAPTRVVGPS
jgi:alpha-tubulin suppressor-like RCC1 family protein